VVEPVVILDLTADAIMDLLVAESEKAQALVENVAVENEVEQIADEPVLENENIDFSWIMPQAETENQVQSDDLNAPVTVELSADETLENAVLSATIPAETTFATANCDAARDLVIQSEVLVAEAAASPALDTVLDKTEENLVDVIEEIVQFTAQGDAPLSEPSAEANLEQTPVNPEPVAQIDGPQALGQVESEGSEARTQLKGLEAIAVYRRVVENNPNNVRIWHLLGNLYSDLGQYEEAIDCLKRTIELDSGKYTYYYHLGLTLAIARRYPEAIQAFEKTIDLAPQHILAHCSLAGCYRRIGNETEARKHIEIARPKLTQEKAYNRACFESISGNSDQAIELLQIALDTDKTPVEWLLRDPDLDFIREDPRFQAMVAELNAPVKEL
jgi:tetratricopeptide (TPR) repeat protein